MNAERNVGITVPFVHPFVCLSVRSSHCGIV